MRLATLLLFICVFMMSIFLTQAQDLGNISDIPVLKASGGVGFNTMYTNTNDTTNQRDPFFWQFQANLNLNLLGIIDAPFSLVLNSQENTVNQPALPTQFGISPNYKAVTGHFGYRTMRFSEYSLGGLMFLGAGVEVKPKDHWLSGSMMYGRFSEALQPVEGTGLGKYERRGYGIRLNAGDNQNYVSLIGFRARDDSSSVDTRRLEEDLAPEDNLIWAILAGKQLGRFSINAEYTTSAITRDTRNDDVLFNDFTYYNNLGGLFYANATTVVRSAIVLNTNLAMDWYNVKFAYRRVAPDFRSLGATSLNDDLEEISGGLGFQLFESKVSVNGDLGVQRNNLDKTAAEGIRKLVTSFNVFWMASQKLNFNASYSNFNSNTVRTATIDSDTLEFFQVSSNGSFMTTYQLSQTTPQSIVFNANYQEATDSDDNANNAFNGNVAYTVAFPESKLAGSASYNYNITSAAGMDILTLGPTMSLSKPIREKVNLAMSLSLLKSSIDQQDQNNITNINLSCRYTLKQKHSFALTYLYTDRKSQVEGVLSVTENRANINYNYRF